MAVHNERQPATLGPSTQIAAGTVQSWFHPFGFPGRSRVYKAFLVTDDGQTPNVTNFAVYTLRNVTKARDIGSRSFATGATLAAGGVEPLVLIGGVNNEVDEGDVLAWIKTIGGTGLAGTVRCVAIFERWTG